eukprot:CAMPEP_0197295326 /NCGR_PEP_ID=MMETSP0890-20130614/35222_1 /TAXON_ID=44058 ORGANISM="Aureoumbra lagunensis, Strain CCMP1510" /NCGR_SAMPLE_ID=MMETSP0890 /ASSEMBLY_ACC=CAM_ASM_000533 /LENGTH=320 /DNA_ID=CAMNT_0042771241 /DNA_START=44 /DNA_END=1006 /DNA_ORIENTATION=+
MCVESIEAEIQYNKDRSEEGSCVNGLIIGGTNFGLGNEAFFVQHGKMVAKKLASDVEHHNDLVPTKVRIENARGMNLSIKNHGIQFVTEGICPFQDMETYYAQLEEITKKLFKASRAKAFCHAARGNSEGYGTWAHTDHAPGSWSTEMAKIAATQQSNQSLPDHFLPPGLTMDDAKNILKAKRFAVISVWRYLGPTQKCRKSHLALLDASSLQGPDDYLHFELRTAPDSSGLSYSGQNFRLKAKEEGSNTNHRWFYFPNMDKDSEAIIFLVYDSKPTFDSHCHIPTVFHAAFFDPFSPPEEPERQSVDVRILLTWDHNVE